MVKDDLPLKPARDVAPPTSRPAPPWVALLAACAAWEQRCLEALAQHFPEHALAIRAVAAHIRSTDADCDTLRGLPAGRHGH